ncbi:hypothetical protein ILYODFUR_032018 [Ilyodon furcidens]|uniref:Uncharacterized protein n=1 Tax=Ilyodon furcidens TaxID=33524 RepID=A0ABV0UKT4_9TELE
MKGNKFQELTSSIHNSSSACPRLGRGGNRSRRETRHPSAQQCSPASSGDFVYVEEQQLYFQFPQDDGAPNPIFKCEPSHPLLFGSTSFFTMKHPSSPHSTTNPQSIQDA